MLSRIFNIVEVDEKDGGSYVVINGQWWMCSYEPGSLGNDSTEVGIADAGHDAGYYVQTVEARKVSDDSSKSYRLEVSMKHESVTDYIEREIADYVLLEEKNELLGFQRLD